MKWYLIIAASLMFIGAAASQGWLVNMVTFMLIAFVITYSTLNLIHWAKKSINRKKES